MRNLKILCTSASLVLATSASAGESSADLLVRGAITPGAACSLAVQSTLSLGTIRRDMLNPDPTQPTKLGDKEVPITVTCPQPQRFAFVIREGGGQDASDPEAFPMRSVEGDNQVGNLRLKFISHTTLIDGKTKGYATGASSDADLGQATWGPSTPHTEKLPIRNGLFAVGFVTQANSTEAPVNMTNLYVRVVAEPSIHPVNDLDLTADIGFSSDLGLEISYF
ncbi:uncharacterized protein DUF1120 [Luteibacter sp. OK325]|uniref:DUF1120 domain-containing protein n=1 Tax=Luteibacter sp. OK325 TaxID=2135670 RepID=UPI000D38AE9B|nr:DUF1120 domain-containing protein [Luteibacter sp. OK325]PTR27267.1 uncharacterized protein DUF1120 [Luteibacter sp. OK325]